MFKKMYRLFRLIGQFLPLHVLRKYVKPKWVADRLGYTDRHIRRLADAGVLPSVRIGKRLRFDEEKIAVLLERWGRERSRENKKRGAGKQ
jgi:excisionase family DNA binding protein